MEYKMICIDVDGTLLNSKNELSDAVKQAIYRITFEKYIPVILVSGRPPQGMEFLQEELDIMRPMICYGGAMIVQEEVLFNISMPVDAARHVLRLFEKADVSTFICSGWDYYVEREDEYVRDESRIVRAAPSVVYFPKLLDEMEANNTEINKVMCLSDEKLLKTLEKQLLQDNPFGLHACMSHPHFLEIMPPGVDKAAAVAKVAGLYGYGLQDVLAIGDNYNDIPMLEAVGLGLAMGNAPEGVKDIAGAVAPGNDQDGVAWAIDKYFFGSDS